MKILHIHIPKNGGSLVTNNLEAQFDPADCYGVDQVTTLIKQFKLDPDGITARYKMVGGHIPFKLVKPYAHRFDLFVSAFRDPWERAYSNYRFICNVRPEWNHLRPVSLDDVYEKFDAFLEGYIYTTKGTRNVQCRYLGDVNTAESALENIDRYNIKMLPCSNLAPSLKQLMEANGLAFHENARANVTQGKRLSVAVGVEPALDDKIRRWFAADFDLCKQLVARNPAPVERELAAA